MFEAFSNSAYAQWLVTSIWGYPTLLTLHGFGMAVVVGLLVMICIRVLGFPKQIPLAAYNRAIPLAIWGFAVNALSGVALFVGDALSLSGNPAFLVKLIAIAIGLAVLYLFYNGPLKKARQQALAGLPEYESTSSDKLMAVLTMLIWLGAVIISGRVIAYLAPDVFSIA